MAIIKAVLVILYAVNFGGYRVDVTHTQINGQNVRFMTAYKNGECVADDVANFQTMAELLTAPHGVKISADEITEHTHK